MKGLDLNVGVYTVYFDAINRGVKTVEYRDMSDYWVEKLVDISHYKGMTIDEVREKIRKDGTFHRKPYTTITFNNNGRKLTMEIKDIKVYEGHTSFAIHLGKRVR